MFILSEEVLHGFSKFCLFNGINRGFHGHFLKKISPLAESAQKWLLLRLTQRGNNVWN